MHSPAALQHATKVTNRRGSRLRVRYLRLADYLAYPWDETQQPLAAVLHGVCDPPERGWPQVFSQFPPLGHGGWAEVFSSLATPRPIPHPQFDASATEDILFAAYSGAGEQPIADQAEQVYGALLRLVKDTGYPHLLRVWHTLPRIHDDEDGLERYRQFCLGRQSAFARFGAGPPSRFPAASVLGAQHGGLSLFALAARAPGVTVENPNQVSAYDYPPIYGPSSPSFSRALVANICGQSLLFLSGTASITGHESRHRGQVAAQIHQTLDNIEALIDRACVLGGAHFRLQAGAAQMRAYVRAREDYETARDCVAARLGDDVEVLYLQADICRRELLFEMDGVIAAP